VSLDAALCVRAPRVQRDLLHRHDPQPRAFSAPAHEGVMLWKLTPEQLDRFLLVAAAILTVVFAVAALGLAFFVF